MKHKLCPTYCKSNDRHIIMIALTQVYKFIHNTVGNYAHTYTKLHTCTIYKHTYQGQYRIKYLHKYRYKLTLLYVIKCNI